MNYRLPAQLAYAENLPERQQAEQLACTSMFRRAYWPEYQRVVKFGEEFAHPYGYIDRITSNKAFYLSIASQHYKMLASRLVDNMHVLDLHLLSHMIWVDNIAVWPADSVDVGPNQTDQPNQPNQSCVANIWCVFLSKAHIKLEHQLVGSDQLVVWSFNNILFNTKCFFSLIFQNCHETYYADADSLAKRLTKPVIMVTQHQTSTNSTNALQTGTE